MLPFNYSAKIKTQESSCTNLGLPILWRGNKITLTRFRCNSADAHPWNRNFGVKNDLRSDSLNTNLAPSLTGPHSTVGNVSGNRCESDCKSRGREFDPCPVLYFRGDWSWNNCYGHSPPFRWIIQEGLLSVTSESMCTKYWLTACSS